MLTIIDETVAINTDHCLITCIHAEDSRTYINFVHDGKAAYVSTDKSVAEVVELLTHA